MSILEELENYLYSLSTSATIVFREEAGLVRAKKLYSNLGNPQNNYKAVHVAGTSGKGSVCSMLSALLMAHGFKVGTHLSPHVLDVRERMMIDLAYPSDTAVAAALTVLKGAINSLDEPVSYFEASVGMGFLLFDSENVDYAVVETGLGGTVDATNTISREDKLAIITRLGIDHERVLGDSLEQIAPHKAGIIQQENHAIALLPHDNNVQSLLQTRATDVGAELEFAAPPSISSIESSVQGIHVPLLLGGRRINVSLPTCGLFQAENAQLAIRALEYLSRRDGFKIDADIVQHTLTTLHVPGRATTRMIQDHSVVFDGAHNVQKIDGLVKSIESAYRTRPLWVFGAKEDKNLQSMLATIATYADAIIFTPFVSKQANAQVYSRAAQSEKLMNMWTECSDSPVYTAQSPQEALTQALYQAESDQPIIVTGSLYLVGELLAQD